MGSAFPDFIRVYAVILWFSTQNRLRIGKTQLKFRWVRSRIRLIVFENCKKLTHSKELIFSFLMFKRVCYKFVSCFFYCEWGAIKIQSARWPVIDGRTEVKLIWSLMTQTVLTLILIAIRERSVWLSHQWRSWHCCHIESQQMEYFLRKLAPQGLGNIVIRELIRDRQRKCHSRARKKITYMGRSPLINPGKWDENRSTFTQCDWCVYIARAFCRFLFNYILKAPLVFISSACLKYSIR